MNILVIGLGNMGSAIACALAENKQYTLFGIDPFAQQDTFQDLSITVLPNLAQASENINVEINTIVLAVKPQIVDSVLAELATYLSSSTMLISTVAGISLQHITTSLQKHSKQDAKYTKLVRIMPTIAAKQKESMTGISFHESLEQEEMTSVTEIVSSFGKTLVIPESQMHAITGMSGSGIAFVAEFIQSLTLAGVNEGLNNHDAYQVALQTMRGALALLSSDNQNTPLFDNPSNFINAVCSPGGTTIEGIQTLYKNGFQSAIFAAVKAASDKSRNLSKN